MVREENPQQCSDPPSETPGAMPDLDGDAADEPRSPYWQTLGLQSGSLLAAMTIYTASDYDA